MVVVSMTDCPASLRGDLTKWLLEINVGVFVGKISARVRNHLWERIKKSAKTGRAVMVFPSVGEQGLDFKTIGSGWIPIDFDGLKLIMRPTTHSIAPQKFGYSKASKNLAALRVAQRAAKPHSKPEDKGFVIIDVETTGLDPEKESIIMLGALKVSEEGECETFEMLVCTEKPLSPAIAKLTGITYDMLSKSGKSPSQAIRLFLEFIGDTRLIAHNVKFDISFINALLKREGMTPLLNETIDTLTLAKKKLPRLKNHKLATIAEHYGIHTAGAHDALMDCRITLEVYEKLLNESE